MTKKPTYEELEQRVKELEREVSECNRSAEELKQEQSVFIGGPVVVFTWLATENWPAAYVSPNVSQFDYQAEDFVSGKLTYTDIIHLEDLDKVLSEVKEFSKSGIPFYEQEYRIIQADGETRWVHDFTIVRRNDEGKITNYDGYILDITSRKQAEENLREREETLRALLNAPTENAMLVDLEGTILALNQVGVQRLGKSEDELIGMGMFDYLPHDLAESRKAQADKVVRTGKPFRFQDERAGRFYDNNIYPVFDINGKVRSLAIYSNDITETKQAEDALRESEERFRKIVKGARAGYFFVDRDGLWQDVNEAWLEMHGYSSREEVIGKHFSLTQVDDDVEMAQRNVEKLLTGEPIESGEFSRRCKDGSVAYHTFSASPVIRGDEIIGLAGFIIDHTELKHAEEQILVANERLQHLLSSTTAVIYTAKTSGDYAATYITDNVAQMLGYEAREFVAKPSFWFDHIHPEDKQGILVEVPRVFELGLHSFEYRFRHKDGTYIWVRDEMKLVRDEDGNPLEIVGYWIDITDRKLAEEALKESEEKYRELFEMESDAILLIENSTGSILEVNQAASVLYGYSKEELLQKKNTDLSSESEDTRAATQERRTYVPVRYHRKKDNIVFPVEITARHFTWQGREVHIAAIRDITDRKRDEEALRDSEFKFRTLFDSSPQAIALTEFQTGKLVDVNVKVCELTKYAAKEIIGRTTTECKFYSEADRARFIDKFQVTGEALGLKMDFKAKDGSTLHMQMFSKFIQIGNEELLLTMFLDMTNQKRLEVQLQQAQKMEAIGTLAGGIAHDFNNLLMGIQGNVSLMLLNIDSTHAYYERLKNIEKQVESGARLTSHLLGYARKGKYEVKAVDLNQLVEEVSETFGRARKQFTIHRELADGLFAIEADPGQIEQVLLNLFLNAADAMPGGGDLILKTINVSHKDMKGKVYDPKPGKYVILTVTDTGMGMDKETMERVFDPFFTTKEMGRGTGLGLASSYGIIKGHGGYIDIESEKGYGTTFKIYLPASEKKVLKVVTTAEEIIKGTGTALLVDDEDVIIELGQGLLEAIGYRVLIARDGKEAIEVYEKNRDDIDIVVLDMVMPNMGGGEAYDRMRKINPDIKVLLSSGYSIDGEASEILERGCNAFIQKPFNMKDLSQAIRKILGKK